MSVDHYRKLEEEFPNWYCGGTNMGWAPLLYKLCRNIAKELDLHKIPRGSFVIAQAKEKFGGLRFYWTWSQEEIEVSVRDDAREDAMKAIHELVSEAEKESFSICERCGKPGTLDSSHYWLKTLCQEHKDSRYKPPEEKK